VDGVQTHVGYTWLTEVGRDLSRFSSSAHFASWLGLCPNNKVSGNHKFSVSTRPASNRLAAALRMAAQSLNRADSVLGDLFRRMRAKLGPAGAVTARWLRAGQPWRHAFRLLRGHTAPTRRSLQRQLNGRLLIGV
jgi:transposase